MGVVHHAAYLPWLEVARVEYLRAAGHPYTALRKAGIDLPVVEVAVSYRRPVRFDDEVDVHLMAAAHRATLEITYLLEVDGDTVATAVTIHAVVGPDGRPVRAPAWLRQLAPGSLSSETGGPADA